MYPSASLCSFFVEGLKGQMAEVMAAPHAAIEHASLDNLHPLALEDSLAQDSVMDVDAGTAVVQPDILPLNDVDPHEAKHNQVVPAKQSDAIVSDSTNDEGGSASSDSDFVQDDVQWPDMLLGETIKWERRNTDKEKNIILSITCSFAGHDNCRKHRSVTCCSTRSFGNAEILCYLAAWRLKADSYTDRSHMAAKPTTAEIQKVYEDNPDNAITDLYGQGVWRRCLKCAGNGPTLHCDICKEKRPKGHFNFHQIRNAINRKSSLRCKSCLICLRCKMEIADIRKWSIYHEKRVCKQCEDIKCKNCGLKPRKDFTEQVILTQQRKDPRSVFCKACQEKGHNNRSEAHTCHGCLDSFGPGKLACHRPDQPPKAHGFKILCKNCSERLKDLQQRVGRNRIHCKCKGPIHQESCHLFRSWRPKDKWWPGADLLQNPVTKNDKQFLERVGPEWWTKEKAFPTKPTSQ